MTDSTLGTSASAVAPGVSALTGIVAGTFINGPNAPPNTPIPSFSAITFGSLKFGTSTLSAFSPVKNEMYDGTTLQVSTSSISSKGSFHNTQPPSGETSTW